MREILFRGKIKYDNSRYKSGQWAFGDLVRLQDGEDGKPHIYGCGEVLSETIGQYTGLTDKNDTKIFEGDIIKFGDKIRYVFFGVCRYRHTNYGEYAADLAVKDGSNIEVIGNIYDNLELLEGR